mgnify:FL=1
MPKEMTYNEALAKLASVCSQSEQCIQSCREKLRKWSVDEEDCEKIIRHLQNEKFVDEKRYALYFAKDKHRLSKWGKAKIANELRQKKIPSPLIDEALKQIADEPYQEQLSELLRKKASTTKAKNRYDLKAKLFRFASSRGFESDLSLITIEKLLKEYETPAEINDNEDSKF